MFAHHFGQNNRPEASKVVRRKSTKQHSNAEESFALDNRRRDTAEYINKLFLYCGQLGQEVVLLPTE